MIVRQAADTLVLITQHDHAVLSAHILAHWQADGLPGHPLRDRILDATRHHDIGWQVEDEAPRCHPDTGLPYDFITMPEDVRLAVWPRAVAALEATPYQAALVAQHALTIYRRYDREPSYARFFAAMTGARDALFARCQEIVPPAALASFMQAYAWLSIADLLSLIVCHGWTEAFDADQYRVTLRDGVVQVAPDPFGGQEVAVRVPGRRIAREGCTSDAALREAYASAPVIWTDAILTGVR